MGQRCGDPFAPREVTLSLILGQCPNLFTEKKISAAEKQITTIDHLPGRYHQAQAVYLSRNSLASLDGLDQFYRLQALSILDGKAVSQAERTAAQGVVQHEGAMLAVMLSSACLCHKLGRAVQMVRLHMELRAAVIGQWGQARYQLQSSWVQPSAACLLQLWHYESTLSWQERDRICSALRREAVRMRHRLIQQRKHGKREPAVMPSWTEAFVEVMRAQQMTIARLLGGFEISKCRAEAHAAKLFGTLAGQRRDSMDATIHDAAFYSERWISYADWYATSSTSFTAFWPRSVIAQHPEHRTSGIEIATVTLTQDTQAPPHTWYL
ncbi:hypothetical protein WJX84_001866 [Apatococcus fuscideae]|uniref:Uncharacterized protein n=1 Tax=Apatococcus fuscideae TaxID=2026836 RepID=A0AAW1SS75_9CHLO